MGSENASLTNCFNAHIGAEFWLCYIKDQATLQTVFLMKLDLNLLATVSLLWISDGYMCTFCIHDFKPFNLKTRTIFRLNTFLLQPQMNHSKS